MHVGCELRTYVAHVTSCPRPNITPSSRRPPFGIPPRSIRPSAPASTLSPPRTHHHPKLFLGGSSIAPNHPHLPSCLSVPLKTRKLRYLFGPSFSAAPLAPHSLFRFLIHGFSFPAPCTRDKPLFAGSPSPLAPLNLPSKLTSAIGMTPDVALASPSFDLRRRRFPTASASLHTIVKGDTDCSLVSSFSLSSQTRSFYRRGKNPRSFPPRL